MPILPRMFLLVPATLMLLLVFAACETVEPPPVEDDPLPPDPKPTVRLLLERFGPENQPPPPEPVPDPQAIYVVERKVLPLNISMEPAWSYVDESVISPSHRTLLNHNGIRVGLLPMSRLSDFDKAAVRHIVLSRYKAIGSMRANQLIRRPLGNRGAVVELTLPPDVPQSYTARNGAVQLLHQAVRSPQGGVSLRLLPHHHLVQTSVQLRNHLDTEFDGRPFQELAVTLNPTPGDLVVVGLYWPWPLRPQTPPIATEEVIPDDAPTQSPVQDVESYHNVPEPAPTPAPPAAPELPPYEKPAHLPPSLGAALFTGQQVGRPAQILYLIRVVPAGASQRGPTRSADDATPAPVRPPAER